MKAEKRTFNPKQLLFKELFIGTLIYVTVLGFFDDYTSFVYATSFSTIFLAAIILELLTYLAFLLKSRIVSWLKDKQGFVYKVLMLFCVWLVMFLSKFLFIWVIDTIFSDNINIHGFFGILWLVLSVTLVHKVADRVFVKLGDKHP